MKIGARHLNRGVCEFTVWAPAREKVSVKIVSPSERVIPLTKDEKGYWHAKAGGIDPHSRYFYVLDDIERPDPASLFQPEGVHGPSEIVPYGGTVRDSRKWTGIPLEDMIIYELHIGTFTEKGTFADIVDRLDDLIKLGVNAIELLPVAQFPGSRNWGYDGVYPFAVQNSYGGPDGLKDFVARCHARGMAVILDVVYNHLGPEGNYLNDFGPYFTKKYRTPWGEAINFDDAHSDEVRNFFIKNALHWFDNFDIDALRLDAVHAIFDNSAKPFLRELAERIEDYSKDKGRKHYLIAESDLNDSRVIRPRTEGGFAIDAQWSDDFHHSLHTVLTQESRGYYQDFGSIDDLAKAIKDTFVFDGKFSKYRKKKHGDSAADLPGNQFIISLQNHDQTGNRMLGERLTSLVPFEALKLAAGALFLVPYIPLLFMGEEYAEENPFLYFVSHSDKDLIEAVRKGRAEEFRSFLSKGEAPDPQAEETFKKSKLNWDKRNEGKHETMRDFYAHLIQFRKTSRVLKELNKDNLKVDYLRDKGIIILKRWVKNDEMVVFFNFYKDEQTFSNTIKKDQWKSILDSSAKRWQGPGCSMPAQLKQNQELTIRPLSFILYQKERS